MGYIRVFSPGKIHEQHAIQSKTEDDIAALLESSYHPGMCFCNSIMLDKIYPMNTIEETLILVQSDWNDFCKRIRCHT